MNKSSQIKEHKKILWTVIWLACAYFFDLSFFVYALTATFILPYDSTSILYYALFPFLTSYVMFFLNGLNRSTASVFCVTPLILRTILIVLDASIIFSPKGIVESSLGDVKLMPYSYFIFIGMFLTCYFACNIDFEKRIEG